MTVMSGEPRTILKATDRCDWGECTARAYMRAVFTVGVVDACLHHWAESSEELAAKADYVIDEGWNL